MQQSFHRAQTMTDNTNNPETILYNDQPVRLEEILKEFEAQQGVISELKKNQKKAIKRFRREEELKPYQAELIKMQQYLEKTRTRMIILFEGRDAAGKGGRPNGFSKNMCVPAPAAVKW